MTHPDYGRSFAAWRAEALAWDAYARHPFVQGLETGDLPRPAFLHYLRQDYVFLVHFSRAWALAVVKAETLEDMKTAASVVDGLVNHEMQLHVQTCAAEGIPESDLFATPEADANLAYTRYVLDAGFSGDFLDLMAALAPCVLGYGEIGARLAPAAQDGHPYRAWIETYASEDYQSLCRQVGALIDAALSRRLGEAARETPRWSALSRRFARATELEVGFWSMGLTPES